MSKEFAMLMATRKLANYLSREHYNLRRMEENERVPMTLLETKVGHYNELVEALNGLFGSLTSSSDDLFEYYDLPVVFDDDFSVTPTYSDEDYAYNNKYDSSVDEAVSEPETPHRESGLSGPDNADSEQHDDSQEDAVNEPYEQLEQWQAEGYNSYDEWLADKDSEGIEQPDDLTVGINTRLSQYRVEQALSEYEETSERDITTYLPEDDEPVAVLSSELENDDTEDRFERPTENLRYLNHTADDVRVDNDPTQIASVKTAVELEGDGARKGTDIDVSRFVYQSDKSVVDDLINDDIEHLLKPSYQNQAQAEPVENDVDYGNAEEDVDSDSDEEVHA